MERSAELDPLSESDGPAYAFGPFRLLPARRILLEDDRPVRLGSRALDILIVLVEHAGQVLDKDTLISQVWPNVSVEDATLRVHLAGLRRALGDGHGGARYIANVTGRGYSLVAPITRLEEPTASPPSPAIAERTHNLPAGQTRIVGRTAIVATLAGQLTRQRFISIVGPGGIGKTTVAVAVAERLTRSFRDGIRFVDLAPIGDSCLVFAALASALEVAIRGADPITSLAAVLRDKNMLLIFDSCEHVIDVVATLVESLLLGAPGLHILVTSREPLRAIGERAQRLAPLAVPPASATLNAAAALMYPAVQLFAERAAASLEAFELTDADAPLVAEMCRKLDGIALAIELAASRIDAFGVGGLARLLEDRFRLLRFGRRGSLPRQKTMHATLDWSYQLLTDLERTILRRLAVFVGGFTLQAATAVIVDDVLVVGSVVDVIADLVAKSLVAVDFADSRVPYRLLDTTRAYALETLTGSAELPDLQRRHAAHFLTVFEAAETEWLTQPAADWLATYGSHIDNLRAALDWAFAPGGDEAIGVALTAASAPLWMHLSLSLEFRRRIEQALASADTARGPHHGMRLLAALGATLTFTPDADHEGSAVWTGALTLAKTLGDVEYQLRSLWGLWADRIKVGDFPASLEVARRFHDVAEGLADEPVGERMVGISLFYLGDLSRSRSHLEHMLARYSPPPSGSHMVRFQIDQAITARMTLGQVLWLLGLPDQASQIVECGLALALVTGHGPTLCNALAQGAASVALFRGDLERLDRHTAMLLDESTRHTLSTWHTWGRCFQGATLVRQGKPAEGADVLRAALDTLPALGFALRSIEFHAEWAAALGLAGDVPRGLAEIDDALARSERHSELWLAPELLRLKGELLLRQRGSDAAESESLFRRALLMAGEQAALSWELRAATSLARLLRTHREYAAAREALLPIYQRFTEGFDTADLRAAHTLLDELAGEQACCPDELRSQ